MTFVRDKMDVISISSYLSSENVTRSVREAGAGARARRAEGLRGEESREMPTMGTSQIWARGEIVGNVQNCCIILN